MINLLLTALLAATQPARVASVDAVVITDGDVQERAAAFRARGENLAPEVVLGTLVDEALLAAEADRRGLREDPAVREQLEQERARAAAEAFLATEVDAAVKVPESALRETFRQTEDFVRLQLLTFEKRDDAQAAYDRLVKGAPLDAEAKKALMARVHAKPADAPWTMRAQLEPGLAAAVFAAKPGAFVGPIALKLGFAVAQVLAINLGDEKTFAARRPELEQNARKRYAGSARAHLSQLLRGKADVKLDEAFLGGLQGARATPADLDHVIATVHGRPLRYREIHPALLSLAGTGNGMMSGPVVKKQLAWQEIDARLLQHAALERGYGKNAAALERAAFTARNVLAGALADRIRRGAPPPTDGEITAFYEKNVAAYRHRPLAEVRADAAARVAAEKGEQELTKLVGSLRKKGRISIDRTALARAAGGAAH